MNQLSRLFRGDKVIWIVVLLISIMGLAAVYSASQRYIVIHNNTDSMAYLKKQLMFLVLGMIAIYFVHTRNYLSFKKYANIGYVVSIVLLVYTLIAGVTHNDGARWIALPFSGGTTFQPSDFAKLALFILIAKELSKRKDHIGTFKKGFAPILFYVLLTCALIAWANLSTGLLLGLTCGILFFIGGVSMKHILLLALSGFLIVALFFTVSIATGSGRGNTWKNRIMEYAGIQKEVDGKKVETQENDQVRYAKMAIANGGVFGKGPGNSWAKDYLPLSFSDFIFSIVIEEYGVVGGAFLLFLYLTLLWRSIRIYRNCPYAFGAFLTLGLSFTLVFQAIINMAVNVKILPVTGLTLPFMSLGGSSILFNSVAIGIILSVSRFVEDSSVPVAAKEDNDEVVQGNLQPA